MCWEKEKRPLDFIKQVTKTFGYINQTIKFAFCVFTVEAESNSKYSPLFCYDYTGISPQVLSERELQVISYRGGCCTSFGLLT